MEIRSTATICLCRASTREPKVIAQVRQALLAMSDNTEGRALLNKVNIKAIVSASDKNFAQHA